jgi:hypothetical protein
MGIAGSGLRTSCKGNNYLSCFENKKITILQPVFLVYSKDNDKYALNDRGEIMYDINQNHREPYNLCNCAFCTAVFIIKINSQITFYIKDILSHTNFDTSGIIHYEIIPNFLNNTNKVNICNIDFIKVPDEYSKNFATLQHLDINNVYFTGYFFDRYSRTNQNNFRNDVLNNSKYKETITNKEKLDFIALKYKDDYLVEDLIQK